MTETLSQWSQNDWGNVTARDAANWLELKLLSIDNGQSKKKASVDYTYIPPAQSEFTISATKRAMESFELGDIAYGYNWIWPLEIA